MVGAAAIGVGPMFVPPHDNQRLSRDEPMRTKQRYQVPVLALACVLGVGACSGNTTKSASNTSESPTSISSPSPTTTSSTTTSPTTSVVPTAAPTGSSRTSEQVCQLLTSSEVESVVGKPVRVNSAHATSRPTGLQGNCSYFAADNLTGVTVVLIGTTVPRAAYEHLVSNPNSGAKAVPVPGLGEAASSIPFGSGGAGTVSVFDHGLLLVLAGQKVGGLSTQALVGLTRVALSRASILR